MSQSICPVVGRGGEGDWAAGVARGETHKSDLDRAETPLHQLEQACSEQADWLAGKAAEGRRQSVSVKGNGCIQGKEPCHVVSDDDDDVLVYFKLINVAT